MAFLGAERLTVNGYDLKTYAKNVTTLGATFKAPAKRGSNSPVGSLSGALWSGAKPYDVPTYTLPMWIRGVNDDGSVPSGSTDRAEFYNRVNELTSLLSEDGLLDVRHYQPDGSVRQALCELLAMMDFTTSNPSPLGKVTIQLVNPGAFWQDPVTLTATSAATVATTFLNATAPMEDAVYTITGPSTNPRLTDPNSGGYFQYNATLTSGQVLAVDSSSWTLTGGSGVTVDYTKAVFVGTMGRLMRLAPNPGLAGGYQMTFTGGGSVTVQGRRKYLVG